MHLKREILNHILGISMTFHALVSPFQTARRHIPEDGRVTA
jgi:hypothetical protein